MKVSELYEDPQLLFEHSEVPLSLLAAQWQAWFKHQALPAFLFAIFQESFPFLGPWRANSSERRASPMSQR